MGSILSFKDLIVWEKSHALVLEVYAITTDFPKYEIFALTSQLRRAAVSIPANIAEGFKKKTLANKINYLSHSEGSLEEVKYYLILSKDLEYITLEKFELLNNLSEEVSKLISGYSKTIKKYHQDK
jgi:four helix bundle protein